ncbi:Aste57867_5086 [Aphanomyces stellatus]|uniref:Aste57867_5086 protein n=1 Tax=Aphanomyces stellatus TaxID=120398 RepID=A0A485KGP5_9STRA|nr:hypothetical protein As57867_005073 [Aphanomyces stellatus]VFT82167.1 Aste57867_5086 [Aphanomyces stellatus]
MLSVDEFIQCCQVFLVHGSAGSTVQKTAHDRLLVFQQLPNAWQVALQVLCTSVESGGAVPDSATFISAQIVRHAVPMVVEADQIQIRDHLLQYLRCSKARVHRNVTPVERLVCLGLASAVVHIQPDWGTWKDQLQRALLDDVATASLGLHLLLEVLAGVPGEIYSACSSVALNNLDATRVERMVHEFQREKLHVLHLVRDTLQSSSAPDASFVALTVLQNWGRDTMPLVGADFGLHCLDLSDGSVSPFAFMHPRPHRPCSELFPQLMAMAVGAKTDVSQLATEIICDAFAQTSSAPDTPPETYISEATLVVTLVRQLLATQPILEQTRASLASQSIDDIDADNDATVVAARNLAKIGATIACGDSHCLFAGGWCRDVRHAQGCDDSLGLAFLNFLVLCTSFPVAAVVEPTLEFWYTVLEMDRRWKAVPALDAASDYAAFLQGALPTLQQVVGHLLKRCQYPASFIETNRLLSDQSDVDDVRELRRDIGDALLSLCSNWPSPTPGNPLMGSFLCLDNMVHMMKASQDIPELDALLFVLDYMVELFDLDDIEPTDAVYMSVQQLWQSAIQDFARFPDHTLLLHGMSRLISSLVVPLEFDGAYYLSMVTVLAKGLKYPAVCTTCAKSLLKVSSILSKRRVDLSIRGECIQLLLATVENELTYTTLLHHQAAYGDFLEALLRFGHTFPDADYVTLVNCAFPRLVASLQTMGPSSNVVDVAAVFYLLARGMRGIQNLPIRDAFLVQEWPLIHPIATHHGVHAKVRDTAVDLFVSMLPSCSHADTIAAIIQLSLRWHDHYAAPSTLTCLGVLADVSVAQVALQPLVVESLAVAFRSFSRKFNFDPRLPPDASKTQLLQRFHAPPEDLAQEAVQFFAMIRDVLRAVPRLVYRRDDASSSCLLSNVLQFGCDVLAVDHKLPDVTDAVCGFFSDVLSLDTESTAPIMGLWQPLATAWVESLLIFVAISTISSKTRCVSNVFHQSLHAGNTESHLREMFGAALQQVLVQRQLFQQQMGAADALRLAQTMLGVKDKRKFQVFLNTTSMYLQGYGPPPWSTPILLSPRSPLASIDIWT